MIILFATSNRHKVEEADGIGEKFGVKFKMVKCPYPEPRDENLGEIAMAGAKHVYKKLKKPIIVEDSGLFVDCLNGFPGSYSRFVFEKIGNDGLLRLMKGERNRRAKFVSVVGFSDKNGVETFSGTVTGTITKREGGNAGFGYDPVFIPKSYDKTFAQDPELKNGVSHRKKSFEKFIRWHVSR